MDEQSGELHSQDPSTRAHPGAAKFENQGASGSWRTQKGSEGWYSDTGGASRFYNHLETVEDVITYLDNLFVGPTLITT